MTMSVKDKMASAFLMVEHKAPYVISALLGLVRKEMPGLGTMGVTKEMVLLWDPAFVEAQPSVEQVAATLYHEVQHPLRGHHDRCLLGGHDPKDYNIAGDCEINDDMAAGGWKLPDGCLYPSAFGWEDGKVAEEYLSKLKQDRAKQKQQGQGGGQGEPQDGENGQGQQGQGQGGAGERPGAGKGWCGSAAGRAVPGEPDSESGQVKGRSEAEVAAIRQEVADAIQEHIAHNGRGSVPGGLARWADALSKPAKIPWASKLRRYVRGCVAYRSGMTDYTYKRPSRRQAGVGAVIDNPPILPSMHSPKPRVAVAIDTSGSMGEAELGRALAETQGVIKALGIPVAFVTCDAVVQGKPKPVRDWRTAAKLMQGGGGTDFCPVFEMFAQQHKTERPDVLVFVTDGQGPAPSIAPQGISTIWVLVGRYKGVPYCNETHQPITWGEMVMVDEEVGV